MSDTAIQSRDRRWPRRAIAAVCVVLAGFFLSWWWSYERNTARAWVVEGWAYGNQDLTSITLHDTRGGEFRAGYEIGSADHMQSDGRLSEDHRGSGAVCIKPLDYSHVRLGVVRVKGEAFNREFVVWVQCLPD